MKDDELELGVEPELDAEPEDLETPEQDDEPDDPIAEAFLDLLSDDGLDFLWDIIGEMVDDGSIDEVPEEDASDEDKNVWLAKNLDVVKEAFKKELNGE